MVTKVNELQMILNLTSLEDNDLRFEINESPWHIEGSEKTFKGNDLHFEMKES